MSDSYSSIELSQMLNSLGNVYDLNFHIDRRQFREQDLPLVKDYWVPYNPRKEVRRYGVSLTSLDGEMSGIPDLDSIMEYNREHGTHYDESSFRVKTDAYMKMKSLHSILDFFYPELGRTHLIRLDKGGFFPPHRDSYGFGANTFRLLALCSNCDPDQFVMILSGQRVVLQQWKLYYVNTRLAHSVFSFVDSSVQLVMNVRLTKENVEKVIKSVVQT